ncbi:MAG TPA: M20/M25/M40 family metallo-hydrolase [Solirubrobacteraceae bacterium]|jgi:acetylornithine deacetylase/succinyl-diaminopimelate desuccinylase-like protein|nr:M20/M25/M40 family metallo-hydrolase [Solirubrobacteraceae bacterium]
MSDLEAETIEVLQRLIRFNTVNPPGDERPAIEYLEALLAQAGFHTEILAATPARANLVATLAGEHADGPTMVYLGHVDTVLADASEWTHDPWSGEIADGYMWGRGTIDMKNQVAAEAVAGAALARAGWRPARGALKLVFVADEETGGEFGAQYLVTEHPDKVRCEMLLNEGGGGVFEFGGQRRYGVCCAEKGIFRFKVTAHGVAGHASIPRTGDNALLKLGAVLQRLADAELSFVMTEAPAALLSGLGFDPADPAAAIAAIGEVSPALQILVEPMLGVTLTPTMAEASKKINVIPSRASLKIDCRVPPGLGEDAALERIRSVLGELAGTLEIEFTEKVFGNSSPVSSELMSAIDGWIRAQDPGAATVPLILPGFSDSSHFRAAFPECIAYGFFPQRHQPLLESEPLMHNADERIDVRDLGFAAEFYTDIARELLG